MDRINILPQIWKYLIIIILIVIAYLPTFSGEFIFDDNYLIKDNPLIKEAHSIATYFVQEDGIIDQRDLGINHTGYYRPLINLTYRLDYKLWGLNAAGFRTTNFILHLVCCLILYKLIGLLVDRKVAFWMAVLFALHPVNTESVSFIVSRNNIIVTLFVLGSFLFYVIAWERKNYFAYIASVFSFAGAVFSKEFGLMILPVLFLYQRLLSKQRGSLLKELIGYIPFFIGCFIYFILRKNVTGSLLTPSSIADLWSRIYFSPFIIFYNLKLIIFPYNLHIIYLDYPANIFNWQASISVLLFLLICLILFLLRKNKRLLFSAIAFLFCLFPVLNIIPSSSISLIAMRWLYLPMAFLMIGLGTILKECLIVKRQLMASLLIITISYFGIYTYVLNKGLWHDDDTLMKQEVLGFNNYLFASDFAEKCLTNKNYLEAEKYFRIAIEKFPYQAYSYINFSALLTETGRPSVAISYLKKAERLTMTHHEQGEWHNNMGTALFQIGDKENGLKYFMKAVSFAPDEPVFWVNLGGAYAMTGDYENSIKAFKKGIDISPESVQLLINLAMTYINAKEYQQAVFTLEKLPEKERIKDKEVARLFVLARQGLQSKEDKLENARN